MSAELLRKSIYALIEQVEDVEFLAAMYKIIKSSRPDDWWEQISPTEKKLIKKGLSELEKGEYFSHDDVMAEVNKILKQD
ncbi:MAG: hypothetical protein KDD99_14520 [Bacteroidetes bacterium]|nr:hypothetical protein [Bacteroidota bacterium]